MKALLFGKTLRGVSTLEIVIAFAIMTLTLTAVILVVFANQSISVDSQTTIEALSKAQAQLESARALARQDFSLLGSTGPTADDIYQKTLTIDPVDSFTKKVTSLVSWATEGRTLSVSLETLVVDASGAAACTLSVSDPQGWKNPQILNPSYSLDISPDTITDIKVSNGVAYLTGYHAGSKEDFFTADVSDPTHPVLFGNPLETGPGLSAVAISGNYAYVANRSATGQLQVIDISTPSAPVLKKTVRVSGAGGIGNSIYYYKNRVYLGLTASGPGPQLAIFDVTSPTNPVPVGAGWSFPPGQGHDINAVVVRGDYAYLAHPEGSGDTYREQVTVLDIRNPAPVRVSGFYSDGKSGGNGKSLYVSGSTLYVGRTATKLSGANDAVPEFFALDDAAPATIPAVPLGSLGLPLTGDSINSLVVKGGLAFFITNRQFEVWDVSDLSNIKAWTASGNASDFTRNSAYAVGGTGTSIGCSGNLLYIASTGSSGGSGHSVLTILGPGI
jgi:hypothetical protein